ncbi:hypothetical protein [Limnohabitans sp. DM1]|uniref:hypothetical protein n=1 Tax=Limnohabitans sp. DM1 TaxID=1597955 RepID=UPI001892B259|nr:hypothetical protein [Limnohabitans sp. DM1]
MKIQSNAKTKFLKAIRGGSLLLSVVALSACQTMTVEQSDQASHPTFTPLSVEQRIMNTVSIKWDVRADAAEFCAKSMRIRSLQPGRELAFITPPMACAIWYVPGKECTVITSNKVSHAVLGHEVRHCFEGHFHR